MQRIYGKPNMKEKEMYELREPQPLNMDRHPDLYNIGQKKQSSVATAATPLVSTDNRQFTIPSSSTMIESEASKTPSKPYFPVRNAYFQEPPTRHPQPHDVYTSPRNLHCVVIADHIMECPICSRFYRNYSPLYNTIIVILLILLLIIIYRNNRVVIPQQQQSVATIAYKPIPAQTI